jgi:hypothetical protein
MCMNYSYVGTLGGVCTMDQHYNSRIMKEFRDCQTAYPDIVSSLEMDSSTEWTVTLTNGVHLKLTMGRDFPFLCPLVRFVNFHDLHGLVRCECEGSWYAGSRISKLLVIVHMRTEAIFEPRRTKLRLMGLLRCAPMLMLWRKRATERLYHPSRIDFVTELRELNALLF